MYRYDIVTATDTSILLSVHSSCNTYSNPIGFCLFAVNSKTSLFSPCGQITVVRNYSVQLA